MAYESTLTTDIDGVSLEADPILTSWIEARTVFDYTPDALVGVATNQNSINYMYDLFQNAKANNLVQVGDPHPQAKSAYATRVWFQTKTTDSTTHFIQRIQYMQPGPNSRIQYDSYQQTENRNFAVDKTGVYANGRDTGLTSITFNPIQDSPQTTSSSGTSLITSALSKFPFVANIPTPRIIRSMRVTQWEELVGASAVAGNVSDSGIPAVWNDAKIWNFAAGELLWIGTPTYTDGTPLYLRNYTFLHNPYGWHHSYAIYVDGSGRTWPQIVPIDPHTVKPEDGTVRQNGSAAFRMLQGTDFSKLFAAIKPPFNLSTDGTDTSDPTDPTQGGTLQGDFPVVPGAFA